MPNELPTGDTIAAIATPIGQAGIGAIYLGHISSEFTLADSSQQQAGQLRDSGFFLREDGSAGTVQQIDLVV